jgi:photosystem II stability/assembly factor-like uncharacterized protein
VNGGRESSPLGDAAPRPRAPWRSNRFLRLGAALVICAVLASGLFLGGSFLTGPASSTSPSSFQPSPTPSPLASATATPAVSGPVITGMVRFDSTSGLVFLSDRKAEYLRATKDGGSTWSELRSMPSRGASLAAAFIDLDHGWRAHGIAAGKLTVARTTDGGKTWQETSLEFPAGSPLPREPYIQGSVHFRDQANGVLLLTYAEGLVGGGGTPTWPPYFCGEFTTSDGGATWSAPSAGRCLLGPAFVSDLVGYAGIRDETWGETGAPPAVFAMTIDGGRTWTDAQLPKDWVAHNWSTEIFFMQRRSDGTLRALCSCGPQGSGLASPYPSVISSNDGGRTWSSVGLGFGFWGTGEWVGAAGEDRWLSDNAPFSTLEVSEDGGLRWQQLAPAGLLDADLSATASMWSNGWLLTSTVTCPTLSSLDCFATSGHLYASDDGGITLRPIPVP